MCYINKTIIYQPAMASQSDDIFQQYNLYLSAIIHTEV